MSSHRSQQGQQDAPKNNELVDSFERVLELAFGAEIPDDQPEAVPDTVSDIDAHVAIPRCDLVRRLTNGEWRVDQLRRGLFYGDSELADHVLEDLLAERGGRIRDTVAGILGESQLATCLDGIIKDSFNRICSALMSDCEPVGDLAGDREPIGDLADWLCYAVEDQALKLRDGRAVDTSRFPAEW
ncbi:MAG: hypothetical protein FJ276_31555 [Planctomycetes bacterium]|nr:hypothetical protein [Planctomycetota bacterium]